MPVALLPLIFQGNDMSNFSQECISQWPRDPEYDLLLKAWFVYHKTCDDFENKAFPPNGMPKTAAERKAMYQNVYIANALRNDVIEKALNRTFRVSEFNQQKWNSAKLEAVRLVEAGYEKIP
jgi:hypothetical protein